MTFAAGWLAIGLLIGVFVSVVVFFGFIERAARRRR
jgi:hypothetical protein